MKMQQNISTQQQLSRQVQNLGVLSGDTIMVHASLRAIGAIEGRGETLIRGLLSAVGAEGTVTAYADYQPTSEVPYFDPLRSPARPDYGIFAELLRTFPNAERSLNPGASMVAVGAKARWLCAEHPQNYGYGEGSPLAKIYQNGGQILLLGSDFDHVTALHFAEHQARLPNKRVVTRSVPVLQDGKVVNVNIEEFDTSELVCLGMPQDYFVQIVGAFIKLSGASSGLVGNARSYRLPARELIDFAVAQMEREYGE